MASEERRSLKYIRLAAYLAGQPDEVKRLTMTLGQVEDIIGARLPANARFPSWWRNDGRRMHSRAWLAAGWEVSAMRSGDATILFARRS